MKNAILKINNLSKTYHDKDGETVAIEKLDLEVYENEFIAIVGPSGCGKSSLLSILAGIESKSSGEILFDREDRKLGYMLQNDSLLPWRTVLDNSLLGLEINKKLNKDTKNKVIDLLNKYGLSDFINKYPNSLSGGMRQRVALIRTLALDPDILLLDEPYNSLDYQTRLALSDDLYKIIKSENKTVIMVTHDLAEAISMADRIVVLSKRPSRIKNIYEIVLTDKSTPINNRKCKEFLYYYDLIWKDIDYHV